MNAAEEVVAGWLWAKGYSCWFVVGKLGGGEREEGIYEQRLRELGVTTVRFEQVVREYAQGLSTRPEDHVGQLLHLLSSFRMLNIGAEH